MNQDAKRDIIEFLKKVEPDHCDHGVPENLIVNRFVGNPYNSATVQSALTDLLDEDEIRHEQDDTYFINDI